MDTQTGAGCIFMNNNLILGGYQKNTISGIGGCMELNENIYENAYRETIEELYDITEIDKTLINDIINMIKPLKILDKHRYKILIHTFEDLEIIIRKCINIKSKLYDSQPNNIQELILNRKYKNDSEIKQLVLLPIIQNITINEYFMDDIRQLII